MSFENESMIAASILQITDALAGKPGAPPVQVAGYQAAGTFALAAAVRDLAAAVREGNADRRAAEHVILLDHARQ